MALKHLILLLLFTNTLLAQQLIDEGEHALNLEEQINPNKEPEKLVQYGYITNSQFQDLLLHLETNGNLLHINEFQSIPSFNIDQILQLSAVIFIPEETIEESKGILLLRLKTSLPQALAYSGNEDLYLGPNVYRFIRFEQQFKHLKIRISTESDPGEKAFQFQSFSLSYAKRKTKVIIGNYQVGLAQGLIIWNAFGAGMSKSIYNFMKPSSLARQTSGSNESNFLSGAYLKQEIGIFKLTGFASSKFEHGNIESGEIRSTYVSGLFRDETELKKHNQYMSRIFGGRLAFEGTSVAIGLQAINWQTSLPWQDSDTSSNFTNNKQSLYSTEIKYQWNQGSVFGELGLANNQQEHVIGAQVALSKLVQLGLVHRKLAEHNKYNLSGAFADGLDGETGTSLVLNYYAQRKTLLSIFYNQSRGSQFAYQLYRPQTKQQWQVNLERDRQTNSQLSLNFRQEWDYTETGHDLKQQLRFKAQLKFENVIEHQIRLEMNQTLGTETHSSLFYYQIKFGSTFGSKHQVRISSFKLQEGNPFFYQFVPSLWMSYGLMSFTQSGSFLAYKLSTRIAGFRLEILGQLLVYPEREYWGSGTDRIEGPQKLNLGLQLIKSWN